MFPQFKKLKNESGIVLFIVLMIVIVIMIFSVGILTQSMNEINYAQQQIDQITSEELAKGLWWNAYTNGMNGVYTSSLDATGRNYQLSLATGSTTNAITNYQVSVVYDTFQ